MLYTVSECYADNGMRQGMGINRVILWKKNKIIKITVNMKK